MEVASLIVSPLLQVIYENLASFLSSVETSKDQEKNIKKLQEKLLIINAVIEDAEKRQLEDTRVKIWLSKLRDVAYDAGDLMDEITTQVLRRRLVKEKWKMADPVKNKLRRIHEETRRQVRSTSFNLQSILSSFDMSRKLTKIVERLDNIEREMYTYHFKEGAYKRSDTMEKRETGCYVEESEVYGRTEDVGKIIGLLLSSDADNWVIPIVGIGGIGKTILAQLIYNDQRLDGHFDKKIWVSLYDKFSSKNLLSEILECVTEHRPESSLMSVLQSQLRHSLCGKRYLLVMDDVWNDVQEEWDKVRNLLRCGAEGSKILVTTRSENVASEMSSTPPYHLGALTKDDCWTLFKQQAFAHGEEDSFSNLLPIGQQIIDKCHGVPLAAKVLGGLLRSKREEDEWLRVRESDLWNLNAGENRILSVLRLSFKHLPSHLKRCFAYCAIFPRNYHLNKEKLIQQWIAGGLFQLSAGDDPNMLERTGNECFDDLLKMSFFQPASSSNVLEFKVPNLVYDLAKYVAGNEFLTIENSDQAQRVGGHDLAETRYALVDSDYRSNTLPEALYKAHKLCTLHLLASGDISMGALRILVSRFRHLKILNLSGSGIKSLHRSIGNLIYLRYLDLSNTPLETLPGTIGDLCNLRTLDLSGCTDLLELPEEMIKLVMLTHLNIKDCARLARLPIFSFQRLPIFSFQRLQRLQTLPIMFATDRLRLNYLENLRGELKIKHLGKTSGNAFFRDKQPLKCMQLHTLGLFWGDGDEGKLNQNTSRQARQTKDVAELLIDQLEPNSNIRRLSINGYLGRRFPDWMNPASLRNLTELELTNCKSCETLPELGQLPILKCLNIRGMDNVVKINEFSGGGMVPFPSLTELTLRDFPELRTWESMGSTEAFPCLKRLSIMKCPFLKTMPWFPTLQHLTVQDCDPLLLRSAAGLRTLLTLVIDSFRELPFIPKAVLENCSLLMSLTVKSCHNLPKLPSNMGKITALKSLNISWCEKLDSLPHGLANLTSLENLEIVECTSLITLPEQSFERLSSLRSLSIENCNGLTSLPAGMQHATALECLTIMCCSNLASLPDGLQNLLALKRLTILCCEGLASLPGVQHMKMLQNLEIRSCPKLMALPRVSNLVSLRSLAISGCQNIKSLPEGIQQLTELQYLSIHDCPELETRCKRGEGEDWQKISHIPFIYVTPTLENGRDTTASSSST